MPLIPQAAAVPAPLLAALAGGGPPPGGPPPGPPPQQDDPEMLVREILNLCHRLEAALPDAQDVLTAKKAGQLIGQLQVGMYQARDQMTNGRQQLMQRLGAGAGA